MTRYSRPLWTLILAYGAIVGVMVIGFGEDYEHRTF
jgi:hypothetical protein